MDGIEVTLLNDVRSDTLVSGMRGDPTLSFIKEALTKNVSDAHAEAMRLPDGSTAAAVAGVTVEIPFGEVKVPVTVTPENVLGLCTVRYINNGWQGVFELTAKIGEALEIVQLSALSSSPTPLPKQKRVMLDASVKALLELIRLVSESIVDFALKAFALAVEKRDKALAQLKSEEVRYTLKNQESRGALSSDLKGLLEAMRNLLEKERDCKRTVPPPDELLFGSPIDRQLPQKEHDQAVKEFVEAMRIETMAHPFISGMLAHVDRKWDINPLDYTDDVLKKAAADFLSASQAMLRHSLPAEYPVDVLREAMNKPVRQSRPDAKLDNMTETPEFRAQMWAEQTSPAQWFDALGSERVLSQLLEGMRQEAELLPEGDDQFVVAMFNYQVVASLMKALAIRDEIREETVKAQDSQRQKGMAPATGVAGVLDMVTIVAILFFPEVAIAEAIAAEAGAYATAIGLGVMTGDAVTIYSETSRKNASIDTKVLKALLDNDQVTYVQSLASRPNLASVAGQMTADFVMMAALGKVSKSADISLRMLLDTQAIWAAAKSN